MGVLDPLVIPGLIVAMAVATLALYRQSFLLFCIGMSLNGVYAGCGVFYRFAAIDGVNGPWRSKAISYVLSGGILAAVLYPVMARSMATLVSVPHAGPFVGLIVGNGLALLLLQVLAPSSVPAPAAERGRSLRQIAAQPVFLVAVLAGMIGYGTMAFVMNATPLAMMSCAMTAGATTSVVRAHVIAMYLPGVVSGSLVSRFGVGWNLLFVGATTLLTRAYKPSEQAITQAANDCLLFSSTAIATFASGFVVNALGWKNVNYLVLPALLVPSLALWWWRQRGTAAVEAG